VAAHRHFGVTQISRVLEVNVSSVRSALARPVTVSGVKEASLRGAAVAALERAGNEVDDVPLGDVFHPREERAEAYRSARERQQQVYEVLRGE